MLNKCPREFVGYEMSEVSNACALADKGFLPETGGSLDQSQWFLNCYRMMSNEMAMIEAADQEAAFAKAKAK